MCRGMTDGAGWNLGLPHSVVTSAGDTACNDHADIEDQGVQLGPHRILLDPPTSDVDLFDTTGTYRSWRRAKRSSRPDGYGGVKVESPGNCRKKTMISPDDKLLGSFVTFFTMGYS
jgi:hypothetical protein